jgi:hypothetical protein
MPSNSSNNNIGKSNSPNASSHHHQLLLQQFHHQQQLAQMTAVQQLQGQLPPVSALPEPALAAQVSSSATGGAPNPGSDAVLQLLMNPQMLSSLLLVLVTAIQQQLLLPLEQSNLKLPFVPQQVPTPAAAAVAPINQQSNNGGDVGGGNLLSPEHALLSALLAASVDGGQLAPAAVNTTNKNTNGTAEDNTSSLVAELAAALGVSQANGSQIFKGLAGGSGGVGNDVGSGQIPPPLIASHGQLSGHTTNHFVSDRPPSTSTPSNSENNMSNNTNKTSVKYTLSSFRPKSDVKLPMVVYMECDEESLSEYQCLLRKQIELFEA